MFSNAHRLTTLWVYTEVAAAYARQARASAFEAAVRQQASAEGITARVEAVQAAFGPAFTARFRETGERPTDENGIRELALRVLADLGVDTRDVHFSVFWAGPDGNAHQKLGPGELRFSPCSMAPAARARIEASIRERNAA